MRHALLALAFLTLLAGCRATAPLPSEETFRETSGPIDPDATPETRALLANLKQLAPGFLLFGHQDALAYGVNWAREDGRSDVHDVTGAYPSVYGWDLGDLENGVDENLDGVSFEEMKQWIREGYEQGSVITISWHMDNPASGGSSWDTTRAVHTLIPGGKHHDWYRQTLDRFADFAGDLRGRRPSGEGASGLGASGAGVGSVGPVTPIPIVFRPFHENTGSWFWWGGDNVAPEAYKTLWRFTVDYLRREKDLHNVLYVYSTDVFDTEDEYMRLYPGDEYVDVMGVDDYHSLGSDGTVPELTDRLSRLVQIADEHGKLPAFTETGAGRIPHPTWFTERLLAAIKNDPVARRIAWVLVWRNAGPRQFYAPYAGHESAPDFVAFYQDPFVLFNDGLPALYRFHGDD